MNYDFDPRRHPPQKVVLHVHTFCNLNCKRCRIQDYIQMKRVTVAPRLVKKILSQYRRYNPNGVVEFSSGELFANKRIIFPYIEHCQDIGLKYVVLTNGTYAVAEDVEFVSRGHESFIVSLDSHREEIHDYIRGKGTYKKVMQFIDLLNVQKIRYEILTVVSKLNVGHLTDIYDFLTSRRYFTMHRLNLLKKSFFMTDGVDSFYNRYSFQTDDEKSYAINRLHEYANHTHEEKSSYSHDVHKAFAGQIHNKAMPLFGTPLCNIYERSLFMKANGNITLCHAADSPPLGNVGDDMCFLQRIWEGREAQKMREYMTQCFKSCGTLFYNTTNMQVNRITQ